MKFRRTAWVGLVALLVAGCASAAPSRVDGPAASAAPISIPTGTYAAEIPTGVAAAPGEWTMEIGSDGEITWTHPQGTTFNPGAVVEVSATEIVFAPDPGCPDQGGEPTEGTYAWSWDGDQLRFTHESDSCAGRRDTLTAAPWEPTE